MGAYSPLRCASGLFLVFATAGCGNAGSTKPIPVDEFIAKIDRLNGQTVAVTGYLGECEALSCMLYRTKAESDDVDRAMAKMRAALDKGATDVSGFPVPDHPAVSIGPASKSSFFDWGAYFHSHGYVVITGKVSNHCRSKNSLCFDRMGDLKPVSIDGAPAPS